MKKKSKGKPKKTKRAVARKPAKRKPAPKKRKSAPKKSRKTSAAETPKPGVVAPPNSVELGRVEDFFAHINVIALTIAKPLAVGTRIHILGHTTNLEQTVDSMQIDHQPVTEAPAKSAVGIKVNGRARRGDHVFLLL